MLEGLENKGYIQILTRDLVPENTAETNDLELLFNHFVRIWKNDTINLPSTKIVQHPAYMQIVSLGRDALPYIFKDLEKNGGLWFSALEKITGVNPVDKRDQGVIHIMRDKWLEWAEERNLRKY